jgi:Uma2 family endonuclease
MAQMKVMVVDERREPIREPYVVRLGGWTMERYLQEAPESLRWEFVRGEVIVYSPATAEHQRLTGFMFRLLQGYCETKRWGEALTGPAAIRFLPEVVREPDLFVLPPEEVPRARGVPLEVRPVLVVEVVSPTTRSMYLGEKAEDYRQAGIPEYWAVDAERREVVVHRLAGGGWQVERVGSGSIVSRTLPGFRLDTAWLFQEPLPPAADCLQAILHG